MIALLNYRNKAIPVKSTGLTSSQMLVGKILWIKIAINDKNLKHKIGEGIKRIIVKSSTKLRIILYKNSKSRTFEF